MMGMKPENVNSSDATIIPYNDSNSYLLDSKSFIERSDIVVPDNATLVIGDVIITPKELKLCMKLLRKMVMNEYPEEFI
jgi:hypothetical protein